MTATHINEVAALASVDFGFVSPATRRELADEYADAQHEKAVAALATKYFLANRDSVLKGSDDDAPNAETKEAGDQLLDYLVDSPNLAMLVRTAFSCSAEVTGRAFVEILVRVMKADAEADALREIAGQRAMLND